MLLTESYRYLPREELEIGVTYYFGQLWDGNGDGQEILDSGVICMYDESADEWISVWFKVCCESIDENPMEALVLIESID